MALGLLLLFAGPVQAAELLTLFTTPQERQIINSNRYKNDDGVSMRPVETDAAPQPVQLLVREQVTREYRVSGITVSSDGSHTVWINSLAYEDGEQLEDSSRVKVIAGDEVKVRITAPDGKQYFAVSGETLEVTYLVTVEN
jgi:hypothetical protein